MAMTMTKGTFEVMWGPMHGNLPERVMVWFVEDGFLNVTEIDERGKEIGDQFWLSAAAVIGLKPFTPKSAKKRPK